MGSIKFCPKCERMLKKKKVGEEYFMVCVDCGYKEPYVPKRRTLSEVDKKRIEKKELLYTTRVKDGTEVENTLTDDVQCPECGHNEAEYFQLQTRSADEPPTTFYKCTKCGHKWRSYG